jgi:hypothetical protein
MNRVRYFLTIALTSLIVLGFAKISVMQIEWVPIALLAVLCLFGNLIVVECVRRTFKWRHSLIWFGLTIVAAIFGLLMGNPLMRFCLTRSLGEYEGIADRCVQAKKDYCQLLGSERKYVSSVSRTRFLPYRTTSVSPNNWYVFVVRTEDDTALSYLKRHPCVRHLSGDWFIEYRC